MKSIKEATDVELKAALFDIQQAIIGYQQRGEVLLAELRERNKPMETPVEQEAVEATEVKQ
jgi:hypothetical protein